MNYAAPLHPNEPRSTHACQRCTENMTRDVMVHGSEIPGRSRGWYCPRHAIVLGYRGVKIGRYLDRLAGPKRDAFLLFCQGWGLGAML